ncbi:MAG: hypothetical protein KKB30_14705 [Proteobacteria bacterium]|nr:hypothetical protein [Pseudomonadota bacterium]MBU1717153.1 hypothetical protein [Pseudomonadota bacterium]
MKRLLSHLILIIATLLPFSSAQADHRDILVVQSAPIKAYDEVFAGFSAELQTLPPSGLKSIQPRTIDRVILQKSDPKQLSSFVKHQPDFFIAIGGKALSLVKNAKVPIIYLLVPDPEAIAESRPNISGISMVIEPARQLEIMAQIFPTVKKIGVIHDPARTGPLVKKGAAFAAQTDLDLIVREVSAPKELYSNLDILRGKIDAYWMVPDLTVITPQTIESIGLFSINNRVPILTFAEKYLENGAAVAISPDLRELGVQAAKIVHRIIAGNPFEQIAPQPVNQIKVVVNHKIIKKMGLAINPDFTADITLISGEK